MKKILLIFIVTVNLFGLNRTFIPQEEAFKVDFGEQKDSIVINLTLHKDIYVYANKIKVLVNGDDITKKVLTKKPIDYHEFKVYFNPLNIKIPKKLIATKEYEIIFKYQGCSKAGMCYMPLEASYKSKLYITKKPQSEEDEIKSIFDKNIFIVLGSFFIFGLLLSLTPCIFPMIPILSSILINQAGKNNKLSSKQGFFISLVYVLSMSVAYTIAGVLAGIFGTNIQAILQNEISLIIFSLIFVALAFSLFGYYSLELPQSLQNKINSYSSSKSGLIGVAIMGFLSALIVGPCVAPPLAGALLYIGQTGNALLGGMALFIMSIGLGVPLLLIGLGANKILPKAGGWMESVSKFFGIIMLALAIYMLDRIIEPLYSNMLFLLLFIFSIYYMLKQKNKLSNIFAIISLLVSLFFTYNIYTNVKNSSYKHNFVYVENIEQLDDIIANSDKIVMVDFWAKWCISCKELEEITFQNKEVINKLKKFKLIKVDVTNNDRYSKQLMKKYNIFGPPAILFFKDGKLIKKIIGYKNPKKFLDIMQF